MAFEWLQALRALHVITAAVWFGGIAISVLLIGPSVKAAGPVGGQFMAVVQKRGGFARIMGPISAVVLASGIGLYAAMGYHNAPFASIPSLLLTIGATSGLTGWLLGVGFVLPLQKRLQALSASVGPGGPSPDQAATLQKLGQQMARRGNVVVVLVAAAMLLMAGRSIVA